MNVWLNAFFSQKLHRSSKYWHKPNIPKIIENAAADRIPIRLGNAVFEKFGKFGKILGVQLKLLNNIKIHVIIFTVKS
jgi:hypothetical protein